MIYDKYLIRFHLLVVRVKSFKTTSPRTYGIKLPGWRIISEPVVRLEVPVTGCNCDIKLKTQNWNNKVKSEIIWRHVYTHNPSPPSSKFSVLQWIKHKNKRHYGTTTCFKTTATTKTAPLNNSSLLFFLFLLTNLTLCNAHLPRTNTHARGVTPVHSTTPYINNSDSKTRGFPVSLTVWKFVLFWLFWPGCQRATRAERMGACSWGTGLVSSKRL